METEAVANEVRFIHLIEIYSIYNLYLYIDISIA